MLSEKQITSATEEPNKSPEQVLWLAVLARAIRDAQGGSTCRDCVEARVWLGSIRYKSDRQVVCDLAGMAESAVRKWNRENSSRNPLKKMYGETELEDALVIHRRKRRGRPRGS